MQDTSLYKDIPIGVCIIKRDRAHLQVLYANNTLVKSLGFNELNDVLGKDFEDIWNTEGANKLSIKLKSPSPPKYETLSYTSTDSKKRWSLISIQPSDYEGQDSYTLWATDISSHKKLQSQLEDAVKEADAGAEQKSNFLATMSHEIRTPMQSVYGLLEIIEQSTIPDDVMHMTQVAKSSANGLLEILDDILDFAKMEANQMNLDLFEVPVRTLISGILEAMSVKLQGKTVMLADHIGDGVPPVISGDPKRLRQIITNLMGNALKFTEQGSVLIKVSKQCKHLELDPNLQNQIGLRFEIVDTGIGMEEEVTKNLFQPFAQADNTTSRKYGGTGLGLSISKKLVGLMNGKIGVISEKGKGSTFWFEIPTEAISVSDETLDMPVLDGISIISVEDHPQGAIEIANSLRSMGASVESCLTYMEGLELIKSRPFDVAIIDHGLPDGNGLDLMRVAMKLRPSMGLIMYTVLNDTGLLNTLQSLGATYLGKPASRIGLGETVQDCTSKTSHIEALEKTKLLIAEDTKSIRDILKRQLDMIGVDYKFVVNGAEAIEELKTDEYGILITDLHMPEMDGYELIKIIRENDKKKNTHFPVIVLTADIQMNQRQVYLKNGFDECLLKPVSLGQFKRLLIRWGVVDASVLNTEQKSLENPAPIEAEKEVKKELKRVKEDPALDRDAIIRQMGELNQGVIDLLYVFVRTTEPMLKKLVTANKEKDKIELVETAHSLKGAAYSACANVLGDIADQIQNDAESNVFEEASIQKALKEFERVEKAIEKLQKDL